jgi:hypothetical protein
VARTVLVVLLILCGVGALWVWESRKQERVVQELRGRLARLEADELVADVAVLGQRKGEGGATLTRLSFVEYRPKSGETLLAKTFEVKGEELYVDALVVRFEDRFVEIGDGLRGRSLLLFRRAFGNQQRPDEGVPLYVTGGDGHDPVPDPLKIEGGDSAFQRELWSRFWTLANDPAEAHKAGIRVAQGEAPHVLVRPHQVYQLKLRATGGLEMTPRLPAAVPNEIERQGR